MVAAVVVAAVVVAAIVLGAFKADVVATAYVAVVDRPSFAAGLEHAADELACASITVDPSCLASFAFHF